MNTLNDNELIGVFPARSGQAGMNDEDFTDYITGKLSPKFASILKNMKLGFPDLTQTAKRVAMSSAPVITSGAASTMSATARIYSLAARSANSAVSVSGFHLDTTSTSKSMTGDNVTTNKAGTTFQAPTKRFSFIHTGRYFEIEFQTATTSEFYVKIDGEYESLTPVSESNLFRKYDLGSNGTRHVEIIAGSTSQTAFQVTKLRIEPTDTIIKAPVKGLKTILVGDSFSSNPNQNAYWFAEAMKWDNVWGSGVGGTGFIADSGGSAQNYSERLQHDVLQYSPDVVGFIGALNDSSQSYNNLYEAVLSVLNRTIEALPNTMIFVVNTMSRGVDLDTTENNRRTAVLKNVCERLGVLFIDLSNMPNESYTYSEVTRDAIITGAVNFRVDTNWAVYDASGQPFNGRTVVFGNAKDNTQEKHYVKSSQQNGAFVQLNLNGTMLQDWPAGTPITIQGTPYIVGTGYVGAVTGYGNSDLLVSSDGLHPENPAGNEALGYAIASSLINAIRLA